MRPRQRVAVVSLGYLYCEPCAVRLDVTGEPVYDDQSAHIGEPCDGCGRHVEAIR